MEQGNNRQHGSTEVHGNLEGHSQKWLIGARWSRNARAKLRAIKIRIKTIKGIGWIMLISNFSLQKNIMTGKKKTNGGTVGGTFHSFHGEILSKTMARTAWRHTTSAIRSTFADLNRLYLLNFPIKIHDRYELVSMF